MNEKSILIEYEVQYMIFYAKYVLSNMLKSLEVVSVGVVVV